MAAVKTLKVPNNKQFIFPMMRGFAENQTMAILTSIGAVDTEAFLKISELVTNLEKLYQHVKEHEGDYDAEHYDHKTVASDLLYAVRESDVQAYLAYVLGDEHDYQFFVDQLALVYFCRRSYWIRPWETERIENATKETRQEAMNKVYALFTFVQMPWKHARPAPHQKALAGGRRLQASTAPTIDL